MQLTETAKNMKYKWQPSPYFGFTFLFLLALPQAAVTPPSPGNANKYTANELFTCHLSWKKRAVLTPNVRIQINNRAFWFDQKMSRAVTRERSQSLSQTAAAFMAGRGSARSDLCNCARLLWQEAEVTCSDGRTDHNCHTVRKPASLIILSLPHKSWLHHLLPVSSEDRALSVQTDGVQLKAERSSFPSSLLFWPSSCPAGVCT